MSLENIYNKVCRTCLIENRVMKSVFSVEKFMEQQAMLCDILMYCASVQISKGDGLPEQVCINCAQEMNRAFLFRKLCEKSDSTLRHYLNSLLPLKVETEYCKIEDPNSCLRQQDVKEICKETNAAQNHSILHSNDIDRSETDYLFQESFDCDEDSETIKDFIYKEVFQTRKVKNN